MMEARAQGRNLRRTNKRGERYTHLLKERENLEIIARVKTKEIRLALHGDAAGFNRKITYDYLGWR